MAEFPDLMHTAIDTTDARGLAEFYREFLGLRYRPGDEPPDEGSEDDDSWLVLVDADGERKIAVQRVDSMPRSTLPRCRCSSTSTSRLVRARSSGVRRSGLLHSAPRVLLDRTEDPEALYVLTDPAGHPFCILTR